MASPSSSDSRVAESDRMRRVVRASPFWLMLITAGAIFGAEACIMLVFLALPKLPDLVEAFIDASLLVSIAVPVIYLFWYRPLRREVDANIRAHAELQHRTFHDPLTRLPNRVYFHERLHQEINIAARERGKFTVIFLDVCRFAVINATLGNHVGDRLLAQVGARLRSGLRASDTVARLGADVFGLVLRGVDSDAAAVTIDKLQLLLQPSFETDQAPIEIEVVCGLAVFPEDGQDSLTLQQSAERALTGAKARGEAYGVPRPDGEVHTRRRLAMFGMLRSGIQGGELVLYYQPKFSLADGTLAGSEALVRWRSAELGLISPAEFIPLAEQTSLIKPLTAWVLGEAVRQIAAWQRMGLSVRTAINLSARNLIDESLPEQVAAVLAGNRVSAEQVTLEVTESAVMANAEQALRVLARLRGLGINLSIDDFGTGYGSLTYLRTVPASEIKIDRSFVLDLESNESNAAIVRSVIQLAHGLGLKVLAEGVETVAALERLRQMKCDLVQGYLFSRPLPAADFERFVEEYPRGPLARQLRDALDASSTPPETGVRVIGQAEGGQLNARAQQREESGNA